MQRLRVEELWRRAQQRRRRRKWIRRELRPAIGVSTQSEECLSRAAGARSAGRVFGGMGWGLAAGDVNNNGGKEGWKDGWMDGWTDERRREEKRRVVSTSQAVGAVQLSREAQAGADKPGLDAVAEVSARKTMMPNSGPRGTHKQRACRLGPLCFVRALLLFCFPTTLKPGSSLLRRRASYVEFWRLLSLRDASHSSVV
ncbi:hypothetical protein JOL62DRAFT_369451 [Phyllosticta paracitricarpa]|uniref:Uncharacterized protein n=1 Tax=Phyllosticta paracitricarpa TaxID=2016321 RepID=A0ABR1MUG9_9PEZI